MNLLKSKIPSFFFQTMDPDETLEGYQKSPYHVVFDVEFDLRRKARLVVGGDHQTGPKDDSYSGVVSLTTIRILFLLATSNKLHLWAADIGNAFLIVECKSNRLPYKSVVKYTKAREAQHGLELECSRQ